MYHVITSTLCLKLKTDIHLNPPLQLYVYAKLFPNLQSIISCQIKLQLKNKNKKKNKKAKYPCLPMRTLSLANSMCSMLTLTAPSIAAFKAAWFTRFSRSAPGKKKQFKFCA